MASPDRAQDATSMIDAWIVQARAQTREAETMVAPVSIEHFRARPAPTKWSIGEHLAHLTLATRPYLSTIDAVIENARRRGLLGDAPYRGTWLGRWFARAMEPPPRLSIRTTRPLVPPPELDRARTIADFAATQEMLVATLERARGVDLGRAHMRSPFFRPLGMTVAEGIQVVLAHNRRHLWHMARALEALATVRRSDPTVGGT